MNTLESCEITNPHGTVEECAKFIIDEVSVPFTLHDLMVIGQQYTLGFWIKADSYANLNVGGSTVPVSTEWVRHVITFTAKRVNLNFLFETVGTYYICRSKLEIGTKDTDWTEAPEDVDQDISKAQDSANDANKNASDNKDEIGRIDAMIVKLEETIQLIVTGLNEGSMMTQTEDGWIFTMGKNAQELSELSEMLKDLDEAHDTTSSVVEELKTSVEVNDKIASYVRIDDTGEQPIIELGTGVNGELGEFRLRITNTSIQFLQGDDPDPIAYISNKQLVISKAFINDEMGVGGFVLKQHGTRKNVGWLWKGVTS